MFLTKIFHFFKGYVILSVAGDDKEKIIAKFAENGIFDIDYEGDEITAKMPASALESGELPEAVKINRKVGFPFLAERMKRKKAAFITVLIFFLVAAVGSQFIWSIDFDTEKGVDTEEILAAAEIAGLKPGAFKWTLEKPEGIKNIILNHTDGICWCWVYIKGTKAIIRVRKSVIPPEIFAKDTPCDIIAMRSGIIKRVITHKGRCVAEENQTVAAGDTIISGTYEFENAAGYQVHSKGIAEAYTTHTRSGIFEQKYCYKTYTGRIQRFLTLKLYKWELPLYIKSRVRFENYDSSQRCYENNYIGVGLKVTEAKEYETEKEPISYDTTVEFAKNQLEKEISRELLPKAQLVSKDCLVEKLDEQRVKVTVTMNFIEEIGTEKRIEEAEFIEPKNNQSAGGD